MLNTHIGHLGIFVSASVAKLEHRAILESLDKLDALAPGLYEMRISNPTGDPDCRKSQYTVHFEERQVEQIRYAYSEQSFEKVQRVSEWNELWYKHLVSPWVTAFSNPFTAEILKRLHPMRTSHMLFSEQLNPWMLPVEMLAPTIQRVRSPADESNRFVAMETEASASISGALDNYRKLRDAASEYAFALLYDKVTK